MDKRCETCRHNLGGGYNNCRINLEKECAAGEYEAWEPVAPRADGDGAMTGEMKGGRRDDES